MTYQPVVVGTGLVAWRFLQATYDTQFEAFNNSGTIKSDIAYFQENIGSIATAEELVGNRRLLSVALTAFGLQDDINNKYLIQKILEDGTTNDDALANKLADDRYKDMSAAFGFGPGEIRMIGTSSLTSTIIDKFQAQSFEVALGQQDDSMRIALYADRTLELMASEDKSETTLWYGVLGEPPLRELFETAFGLPSGVGLDDIEKQVEIFREYAQRMFGDDSITQFSDPESREKLITAYTARVLINQSATSFSPAATALQLLQS